MEKRSPTVGAYFFAEDYVKFCKNLKYYLTCELEIVPLSSAKHYASILKQNNETAIVGRLDDIELVFLHYSAPNIIIEKWKQRVCRINWERIILKFSYQNECNDELIRQFLAIEDFPKFVLTGEKITDNHDEIIFKRANGKETVNETNNFNWFINPIKVINERC